MDEKLEYVTFSGPCPAKICVNFDCSLSTAAPGHHSAVVHVAPSWYARVIVPIKRNSQEYRDVESQVRTWNATSVEKFRHRLNE